MPKRDTPLSEPSAKPQTSPSLHSIHAKGLLLHFFTNMAVVGDVADELARVGFGRIHHRILFFAAHAPGLTVNELLEVLRVSHPNIRLPMKHLLNQEFLRVEIDPVDRRQKRLYVTESGKALIESLLTTQIERIRRVFDSVTQQEVATFLRVHALMIDETDHRMLNRIWGTQT